MSLATLDGNTVTKARVNVPSWGCWWAGVDLAEPIELAAGTRVSLVIAGQAFSGTIMSGGAFSGRAAYYLAGGAGSWGKTLPSKPYSDDSGLRLQTVLGDAASEAGETLGPVPSTTLGPHYARRAGAMASEVLNAFAPRGWYVDFAGVTQVGLRTATTYTGSAPRVRVDPAVGVYELAVDSLEGLLPGVSVDGSAPATDVEFHLTPERLTAKVYAAGGPDSERLALWRQMFEALDPLARYRATYEFRVVTQTGERLNLQPVRVATGMPDLANVPVHLAPGVKALHALGSLVLVIFADGDPSRPRVIAGDAADAPGWMPLELDLGGPAALGVARLTDAVQAGPFAGVITFASARIKASL